MSSGLYSGASGLALGVGLYRQVAGLWSGASGLMSGFGNPIPPLFAGGAQGAWFDFTDTSTWYQDAARTTPAATLGGVVGLVLDKSRGLALGPELVTNGGPFTATTGWTPTASATLSVVGSKLRVTTSANFQTAAFAFTTVVGQWYTFTATASFVSGLDRGSYITKSDAATSSVNEVGSGINLNPAGVRTITACATATTTYIRLGTETSGTVFDWTSVSVKLLAGNHASQATTVQKPLRARIPFGGRRNMLTYTEDFSNAVWTKTNATVTANATTAPDGTNTGTLLTQTGSGGRAVQTAVVSASVFTYTIYVKKFGSVDTIGFILRNGTTATNYGTNWRFSTLDFAGSDPNLAASYTDVGGGWYRLSLRADTAFSAGNSALVYIYGGGAGTTADSVYAWGAQLEKTSATAYQKVVADWDVTESGVTSIPALYYDGSDDSLATAAIDFTGTDTVTVFAGVEKLSDAAAGVLIEASANSGANNGTFAVFAPSGALPTYSFRSRGTGEGVPVTPSSYVAPVTNVLTALGDISTDTAIIRINGAEVATAATDQGTGNYGTHALFIGRRGGANFPFKGYMIGHMVIVGKLANASEIAAVEATQRAATGAY